MRVGPSLSAATFALAMLTACAGPHQRFDRVAEELGFTRETVRGKRFSHVVYVRNRADAADALHVYFAGDGTPWLRRSTIALDPTPRRPLTLRLTAMDPGPAVLIGRPCYHGLAGSDDCSPLYWTHWRYSEPVVTSLAQAVSALVEAQGRRSVRLFGYSGGGALAALVASRLASIEAVVTVAGNMSHRAWARLHGYDPLRGSLDPAPGSLPEDIYQLHLVGSEDRNVPPAVLRAALGDARDTLEVVDGYDHRCCWEKLWPSILERVAAALGSDGAPR